jgi:predicted acylesterase/phospholipase RssA
MQQKIKKDSARAEHLSMSTMAQTTAAKPYQRCLVMAGGGFRFGYYLGMMAAFEQHQRAPDVLVASCGAAIAAAVIQGLPDNASRLEFLSSPQMYAYWCGLGSNPQKKLSTTLKDLGQRALWSRFMQTAPDLYQDYLFEVPPLLPLPEPQSYAGAPDLAIIAGRVLYPSAAAGSRIGGPWFEETVFAEGALAAALSGMVSPLAPVHFPGSRIAPQISVQSGVALKDAVRASISDMYYFRCHEVAGQAYIGGVVDLFPIEIASRLASQVVMERKAPYDRLLGLPAVRAVLGFDGNQRIRQVNQQFADYWVDTADMTSALTKHQIGKRINWRANRIELVMPATYPQFRQMLQLQWDYGYQRACQALGVGVSLNAA